jgi:hypothetical protein
VTTFIARMREAAEAAAAAEVADATGPSDPWELPLSRSKGRIDWDGYERVSSQQCLDLLELPQHARKGTTFRRLSKVMQKFGWAPIRIKAFNGTYTERVRGYSRPAPNGQPSLHQPSLADASTEYLQRVAARLAADSRWKMSRAVEEVARERDSLRAQLHQQNRSFP